MKAPFVQTPHLAILHLLRSQGCCSDQSDTPSKAILMLSQQKHALETELSITKQKMQYLPCAVRLQDQVCHLQQLTTGLKQQNQRRREQGWQQAQKLSNMYSTQSTEFLQQQSNRKSQELIRERSQQRRLEQEYQILMLRIRKLHEWNEGIVNSYGKCRCE